MYNGSLIKMVGCLLVVTLQKSKNHLDSPDILPMEIQCSPSLYPGNTISLSEK